MFHSFSTKLIHAKLGVVALLLSFPFVALAQKTVKDLLGEATTLVTRGVIALLMALVLVAFFANISKLLSSTADPSQRKEIKQRIFWMVALMFVLVAVWGIISQVGAWFGITVSARPE